jgi:hypothetical protein
MTISWPSNLTRQSSNTFAYGCACSLKINVAFPMYLAGKVKPYTVPTRIQIQQAIDRHTCMWRSYVTSTSKPLTIPTDRQITELLDIYSLLKTFKTVLTTDWRQPGNVITIYHNDEQTLYDLGMSLQKVSSMVALMRITTVPIEYHQLIKDGKKIVTRIDTKWTHHVTLTDGFANSEYTALYDYLKTQVGLIEFQRTIQRKITSHYVHGCWFRTSDEGIITFAKLIAPGVINKVIELYHE